LRERYLNILWPILAVLIAVSCWFGVKAGGDNLLKNDYARSGIGSLERAGSVEEARWIISTWNQRVPERRSKSETDNLGAITRLFSNQGLMLTEVALRSLVFDLFFIFFYASAMAVACLLAATEIQCRRRKSKSRLVALGMQLALMQIVTAGFDVVENIALWRMLSAPVRNPWPWIAYVSSIAKFALLAVSLFYIFIAFVIWVIDHRRPSSRKVVVATT
jgi:hypothetical protein